MLESLPVKLIVGTVLGFLSGLGIGGGSLLILWLTLVVNADAQTARSINLLFFLPSALISCAIRLRQGDLKTKPLLPAVLSGCAAAAALSLLSTYADSQLIRKLFGILFLAAGIRELTYRPR